VVLRRERDMELMKIRDNAEKEKIRRNHQNKMAELQQQQQEEKTQLLKRHRKDSEAVQKIAKQAKLKKRPLRSRR